MIENNVKELELSIDKITIDGVELPIDNISIRVDMKTTKLGTKNIKKLHNGKIFLNGSVLDSAPLSKERTARSWNMNVKME